MPLITEGDPPILASGTNKLIWAYGGGNELGYHADRGRAFVKFTPCNSIEARKSQLFHRKEISSVSDTPDIPTKTIRDNEQNCSKFQLHLNPLLTLDYVVKINDKKENTAFPHGIMSARVTHAGLGWIGFGVSLGSGSMMPGEAIIGLPDEPMGVNNPGKYSLAARNQKGVLLFPESSQTLMNATMTQTDSQTILTFKKHLIELNDIPIDGHGQSTFV